MNDVYVGSGGLQRHLREAISLNTRRRRRYLNLTQGKSRWISWILINSERVALIAAAYVDARAKPFQKAGIPIVNLDLVSMESIQPFEEKTTKLVQPIEQFRPINVWKLIAEIGHHYKQYKFDGVGDCARSYLQELAGVYTYHGMVRHLLESILRISRLAKEYIKQADELQIASPAPLSWTLIKLHLMALPLGAYLDKLAAPIQAQGVPIIIQDVPQIDVGEI